MNFETAKKELNKAFKEYKCQCEDKGLCEHSSNPFALEETLAKIYQDFENRECGTCKFFDNCEILKAISAGTNNIRLIKFSCNEWKEDLTSNV